MDTGFQCCESALFQADPDADQDSTEHPDADPDSDF
jgi:hypothetical protein